MYERVIYELGASDSTYFRTFIILHSCFHLNSYYFLISRLSALSCSKYVKKLLQNTAKLHIMSQSSLQVHSCASNFNRQIMVCNKHPAAILMRRVKNQSTTHPRWLHFSSKPILISSTAIRHSPITQRRTSSRFTRDVCSY